MQLEKRVAPRALSVSQLTSLIKDSLEADIGEVWVVGEVSNLKAAPSGHVYFTLKDERSEIAAVLFRGHARLLTFELADGQEVLVRGRVSLYPARGKLQLYAELVEPRGAGALQLAFERLKRKLDGEGLFSLERKRPLPAFPRCVGIVTAPQGAAIHDMVTTLHSRFPPLRVVLRPSRVQGVEASAEIAKAIDDLNRLGVVDVMIVGRGGGSLEDLWPFNEEAVARAIARSAIPVVSAVGHEVDFTIADFVADKRAATPTAAAELVVPCYQDVTRSLAEAEVNLRHLMEIRLKRSGEVVENLRQRLRDPRRLLAIMGQRLDEFEERGCVAMGRVLRVCGERLLGCRQRLLASDPRRVLRLRRAELAAKAGRLGMAQRQRLSGLRQQLGALAGKLDGLSPLAVLERGYSIVRRLPSRVVVRDAETLVTGDLVELMFSRGRALARVEGETLEESSANEREEGQD